MSHMRTLSPAIRPFTRCTLDTLQAQAIAVWQQQQIQGGHLFHDRMLATPGAMAGARLTHEQHGIPPVNHPQLCWLPPQMVSTQLQMGMQPQMHHGATATGSPQLQLYQQHQQHPQHLQHPQHPQHPQHLQHHDVGGYNGRSPLQPAQLGSPPPLACADAPSDAHISEQVMHVYGIQLTLQVLFGIYYGQVKQLLKKLANAHEEAPSVSNVFASAADTGFGFDLSLGSVLSPHAAPHPASPAPYLAPISPQLGEAALPGNCEYPGGGDNQRPNAGFFAESCGQKAGASSGSGGVGPTDATPRLVKPLPAILSNRAVSFAAAFKCGGGAGSARETR